MATICAAAPWRRIRRSCARSRRAPARGTPVLGICNGFQILSEAGLLPGALLRNADAQIPSARMSISRVETQPDASSPPLRGGPGDPRAGGASATATTSPTRRRSTGSRRGPGRVPLLHARGRAHRGRQPQRLGAQHRRHLQREQDGAGPDAASRGRDRPAARPHRRPGALRRRWWRRSLEHGRRRAAPHAGDRRPARARRRRNIERACRILGREPNLTELGIFSVMWSRALLLQILARPG